MEITQAYLREIFNYDPETGELTYRKQISSHAMPGQKAGYLKKNGYVTVGINYKKHLAHRLIWLYMTGEWPKKLIDHIDHNQSNNAFSNLREADAFENCANTGVPKSNGTGFKGVRFDKRSRKFQAGLIVRHKKINLGSFDCPQEAAHAYNKAVLKIHGEFAVLNPIGEPKPCEAIPASNKEQADD